MTTQSDQVAQGADSDQVGTRRCGRASSGSASSAAGLLWFGGWLFTLGFAKLVWWKAVLAVVLWPYFLGATIR